MGTSITSGGSGTLEVGVDGSGGITEIDTDGEVTIQGGGSINGPVDVAPPAPPPPVGSTLTGTFYRIIDVGVTLSFTFNADGTGMATMEEGEDSEEVSFTYSISGNALSISGEFGDPGEIIVHTATLAADRNSFTIAAAGNPHLVGEGAFFIGTYTRRTDGDVVVPPPPTGNTLTGTFYHDAPIHGTQSLSFAFDADGTGGTRGRVGDTVCIFHKRQRSYPCSCYYYFL